ncbi:MAG: AraC family transcriptional regulator [Gammaproteobacteria bacterium]|nr:AraC family transcriptional regulator [Gammaproteobacteria bacterium]
MGSIVARDSAAAVAAASRHAGSCVAMYACHQRGSVEFVTKPIGTFGKGAVHQYSPAIAPMGGVGSARIDAYRPIPALLLEMGVALSDVLADAGVRADIFEDPDNLISYAEASRLLAASAKRANCDHLGLLIGQRSRLANMGLAGQLARCRDTAGEALQLFVECFTLQNTAAAVSLVSQGGFSRFVFAIVAPGMRETKQLQIGAMAISFNILQDLCGRQFLPAVVTFATGPPANLRPFHQFFRAPLRFDSHETALVFETRWLERPLPPVDPVLRRQIETKAHLRQTAAQLDLPSSVRRALRRQLAQGDVAMESTASGLGMHRRTLDRRLKKHGTSYFEILEAVKYEIASQLLRDTDLGIGEIAQSLHYSSNSNFSAAFRRWTGLTPSAYRSRSR